MFPSFYLIWWRWNTSRKRKTDWNRWVFKQCNNIFSSYQWWLFIYSTNMYNIVLNPIYYLVTSRVCSLIALKNKQNVISMEGINGWIYIAIVSILRYIYLYLLVSFICFVHFQLENIDFCSRKNIIIFICTHRKWTWH